MNSLKSQGIILFSVIALFGFLSFANLYGAPPGTGWTMTFDDEFNGAGVDTTKWSTSQIWGSGEYSGELELYNHTLTSGTNKNLMLTGSSLKIIAINDNPDGTHPYSSGLLSTYNYFNQAFGYFEMRAKMSPAAGSWPAFWFLEGNKEGAYNWPPEIDVIECPVNSNNTPPTIDYMTQHWSTNNYPLDAGTDSVDWGGSSYKSVDLSLDFHTYGFLWDPDKVTWYFDGVPVDSNTGKLPYLRAMHIILQMAIGNWGGTPNPAHYPAAFEVDYMQAYARALPSPWSSGDVGSPATAGRTYASESGLFNVYGSGTGITGTSDQFQFAYQTLTGDGTLITRVKNEVGTNSINVSANANAVAGLMIRETLNAGASNVLMALRPVAGGIVGGNVFSYRAASGGTTSTQALNNRQYAPSWLKLVRSGNTFTGYMSADGNNWVASGTATVAMASNVYAGLAVTSSGTAQKATAQFDNITTPAGNWDVTGDPFVTTQAAVTTALGNGYTRWQGFKFTVGANPLKVTQLGRWVQPGNGGTHTVKLVVASTGSDVSGGSVSVNTAGAPTGQFQYASLPAPVTLSANTVYYLVSQETAGGDKYYDNVRVQSSNVATINDCVNSATGAPPWNLPGFGANHSFGFVNFMVDSSNVSGSGSTGRVGWWKLDEGSGTTAGDSSGNGNNGMLSGNPAPAWTTGTMGSALSFNGSSAYVDLNNGNLSNAIKQYLPMTVAGWIKVNSTAGMIFASDEWDTTKYAGYCLQLVGGKLVCNYGDAGGAGPANRRSKTGTTVLTNGQWYHVAAVIQGPTNMQIYLNGTDNGGTYSGNCNGVGYTTASSKIGAGGTNANLFNGIIDDVQVYNYALSASEVAALAVAVGPLATITVTPSNASVQAGGTQQFTAVGKDAYGNTLSPQPAFTWSVTGGGSIDSNGLLTSGTGAGGPYTVTAASGGVNGTASVTVVTGALATISVNPSSASIQAGGTQQFTAVGKDAYGNTLSPQPAFTWSVTGGGSIDSNGLLTAGTGVGGPYAVAATSGTVNGASSVTIVAGPLAAITVNPSIASIQAGGTQQFTAVGKDAYGNTLSPQPAFTWSVTGGGSIDSNGLLTSGTGAGGPYTVTAASGTVNGTAGVTIVAGSLAAITVSPANASIQAGTTQQFSALGTDGYGNALSPQPAFTWSVSGGGSMDGNGLFTSGSISGGPYTVTAASGSVSGTTSLSVVGGIPAAPTNLAATWATMLNGWYKLTWTDNSNNETGFTIQILSGTTWSTTGSVAAGVTAYQRTGLNMPSGPYTLRVIATGTAGNSAPSNQVTFSIPTPPSMPDTLVATPGTASVGLTWGAVAGAANYNIARSSTSGTSGFSVIKYNQVGTSYTDSTAVSGTLYWYKVCYTVTNVGMSLYCNPVTATPN